jgi:HSP20 family molecular chaperone IbpA
MACSAVCYSPAFIAEQFLIEQLLSDKKLSQEAGSSSTWMRGPLSAGFSSVHCQRTAVDVLEGGSEYLVVVDVPGFKPSDLSVSK